MQPTVYIPSRLLRLLVPVARHQVGHDPALFPEFGPDFLREGKMGPVCPQEELARRNEGVAMEVCL